MTKKTLSRAEAVFGASERREQTIKEIIEKERAAVEAKSARLKALRLAKEAEDREAAEKLPPKPEKAKRAARKRPVQP